MKKRTLAILILSILAILSFTACGDSSGNSDSSETPPPPSAAQPSESEEPTESPDAEPSNEPAQGGEMVGSGDLGDYHVEIKSATLVKDYEDNPAILITYAWTNNSEDTTSAMVTIMQKAFQDGVELETAILFDVEGYDPESSMKDVRPGTTIDVQSAFVLTSETSTVEFEITEFMSFTDDMVSMDFDPASL